MGTVRDPSSVRSPLGHHLICVRTVGSMDRSPRCQVGRKGRRGGTGVHEPKMSFRERTRDEGDDIRICQLMESSTQRYRGTDLAGEGLCDFSPQTESSLSTTLRTLSFRGSRSQL